jgi:hypothetical protein
MLRSNVVFYLVMLFLAGSSAFVVWKVIDYTHDKPQPTMPTLKLKEDPVVPKDFLVFATEKQLSNDAQGCKVWSLNGVTWIFSKELKLLEVLNVEPDYLDQIKVTLKVEDTKWHHEVNLAKTPVPPKYTKGEKVEILLDMRYNSVTNKKGEVTYYLSRIGALQIKIREIKK